MKDLAGRVAVVTGAASGIGCATARALAAEGCRLALADVDAERLAAVATELGATAHVVDVAEAAQVEALAAEVVARHGAAHVVINNAGIALTAPFEETTLDEWRRVVGVNLWGVVHGCRAFLPHLRAADEAHLVNVSSAFGIAGVPGQSAYCATKFAVRGLTEVLWEELRGTNVGVTVVHPGGIATRIVESMTCRHAELSERVRRYYREKAWPPELVARAIIRAIRRRRPRVLVTPEAHAIDWLRRLLPVLGNRLAAAAVVRKVGLQDLFARLQQEPR